MLDVGAGTGAPDRGARPARRRESVTAIDPSEHFVLAVRSRHPGVTVERASAENLPLPDDRFDTALAQLVVHFMSDPEAGLREMGRVTQARWRRRGVRLGSRRRRQRAALGLLRGAPRGRPVPPERVRAPRDPPGPPGRALRRRRLRRGAGGDAHRARRARELRGLVGAVRARRRPHRPTCSPSSGPRRSPRSASTCRKLLPPAPFTVEARAWAVRAAA